MERTLIKDTPKFVGKKVKISGWVSTRRDHGELIFLDVRDRSATIQLVFSAEFSKEAQKNANQVRSEYAVEIEGTINKRPKGMEKKGSITGSVEMSGEKIDILAKSEELPLEINKKELNANIDTILDNRSIALRHPRQKAIFKVQSEIMEAFRSFFSAEEFTEIQTPEIVESGLETGGAQMFKIKYFNKSAYLAQSPQMYKQIMVGVFERVFEVNPVFRAEPHNTSRHLNEYISLDIEMGFIDDFTDLIKIEEKYLTNLIKKLKENCSAELELLNVTLPEIKNIPQMKLIDAQKVLEKEYKEKCVGAPDLDPKQEKLICEYSKKKFGSEFIFITHYPTKKRPFYTMPDPKNPESTLSFDLIFRGLEVTTGGQRIHKFDVLKENMEKFGLDTKNFKNYLEVFRYGMPPHGGLALGLERLTMQMLNLSNIREACLFPRDLNRLEP